MSQYRDNLDINESDEGNIAVTAACSAPSIHSLPSFREVRYHHMLKFLSECFHSLLIMFQLLPEHLHNEIDQGAYYSSPSPSANRHRILETTSSYNKSRSSPPYSYSSLSPGPGDVFKRSLISSLSKPLQSSSRHERYNPPMRFYGCAHTQLEIEAGIVCTSTTTSAYDSRSLLTTGSTTSTAAEYYKNVHVSAPFAALEQSLYYGYSYPDNSCSGHSYSYDHPVVASSSRGRGGTLQIFSTNASVVGGDDPLITRAKRRKGNLPTLATDVLRAWFHQHLDNPYPTEDDKQKFISRTGLTMTQVCLRTLFYLSTLIHG
ncbi:hypothetical protein EIK77_000868 [Talaromyces pinophilus]|nr:hypothetical protein EIK77_000868 [Talaromyces pinophilus]